MRILFSLSYYLPYTSGLSVYVSRLAVALRKKGDCISVITSQHDKKLPLEESEGGVRVVRVPVWKKFSKGLIMPKWFWQGWQEVRKSDTVISNLPQPEAFYLLLAAKILNKKSIVIYHCDVRLPCGLVNRIIEWVLQLINQLCCNIADIIVCSSMDYASLSPVVSRYLDKVRVVYPPIRLSKEMVLKKEKNLIDKATRDIAYKIGFVGRLSAEKGIESLLEVIRPIRKALGNNLGVYLVGPKNAIGEIDYIKRIHKLMNKHRKVVSHLGFLTNEGLSYFYKNIDLLVLPSTNSTEAFGMVQAEAILGGARVVASSLPGVRVPILISGAGTLFDTREKNNLAWAIVNEVNNKRPNNSKRMKKVFSENRTVNSFREIIEG
ncbi:MAG: glycosyltransferase family 4 protein [Patescibacteria group bacterium]|jgi:glycosyltransferase involved in cell wall biosynthesis